MPPTKRKPKSAKMTAPKRKDATELEYLTYFRQWADFGPASDEVVRSMDRSFEETTGKRVPKLWRGDEA